MFTTKVYLNSIEKLKGFVNAAQRLDCNVDAGSGHYIVDAKSVMGLMSLDLSKPVSISVACQDRDNEKAKGIIAEFIAGE